MANRKANDDVQFSRVELNEICEVATYYFLCNRPLFTKGDCFLKQNAEVEEESLWCMFAESGN
jgi:hypothetical protein